MRACWQTMLLCTLVVAPAAARDRPVLSWGKAGVSFDQYRADAIACASQGYFLDVADTEAAKTLRQASSQLAANEADLVNGAGLPGGTDQAIQTATRSAQIVAAARPDKQMQAVARMQHDTVARCLGKRGYRQFSLTHEQARALKRLRRGSPERHAYLYRLGSDPQVLAAQGV